MSGNLVINGQDGTLSWGYYLAARVPTWTIARAEDGSWTLSGELESVDPYRVSQHPLVFTAPNSWRWNIMKLQIASASITATLGSREYSDGLVREAGDYAAPTQ
jgi:hypothetical protein